MVMTLKKLTKPKSVSADGFYVSATHPALGQADQFSRLMRAAGY
jgi:hypothetical protein